MKIIYILLFFICSVSIAAQNNTVEKIKIRKPACTATILGRSGGTIRQSMLYEIGQVQVYHCHYVIESFDFTVAQKDIIKASVKNQKEISPDIRILLYGLKPGDRFYFEKIKAKDTLTNKIFTLPNMKFSVVN